MWCKIHRRATGIDDHIVTHKYIVSLWKFTLWLLIERPDDVTGFSFLLILIIALEIYVILVLVIYHCSADLLYMLDYGPKLERENKASQLILAQSGSPLGYNVTIV